MYLLSKANQAETGLLCFVRYHFLYINSNREFMFDLYPSTENLADCVANSEYLILDFGMANF